jgi:hypothetical protein
VLGPRKVESNFSKLCSRLLKLAQADAPNGQVQDQTEIGHLHFGVLVSIDWLTKARRAAPKLIRNMARYAKSNSGPMEQSGKNTVRKMVEYKYLYLSVALISP